ncbi:MAG TPA: pitrilysin family protein [Kofleriaceae bacterium]|nr:pitrilysin family protein [Kofleriaceae bacterium]
MKHPRQLRAALAGIVTLAATMTLWGTARADDPEIAHERYMLDNGIQVILHRDNSVPIVAVDIWYHAGSGDETPGKSGFAHLFEHMLFQGSKHVGEDRHFDILKSIGATAVNGSTNKNRTNYFEVVPSNELETALWLESDRMGYFLPMLTKESLANQIEVVSNERRQRVDNQPYGKTRFATAAALYPEGHPYRYMVIGRFEDLTGSSVTDVRNFYLHWYSPGNATLCIAGDFDTAQVKKLVDKWFGSFPKTPRPEHVKPPTPVISHTRIQVEDTFAKLRRIDYVWHTPAFFAPGDAELDILAHALAASGTGRLYKILVHEKQLAQSVVAYQDSDGWSSTFNIQVTLKSGADLAAVEKILDAELGKVLATPITKPEFQRAVVDREASFVWGLERLLARAETLQRYNHFVGNPDYISEDLDRYRKSSPEKVQKVAATYLTKDHRLEVLTVPSTKAAAAGTGAKVPAKKGDKQ